MITEPAQARPGLDELAGAGVPSRGGRLAQSPLGAAEGLHLAAPRGAP